MTHMVIPDSITPAEGWRAWRVKDGRLRSVTAGVEWPVREPIRATCNARQYFYTPGSTPGAQSNYLRHHEEPAPFEACQCGIYAIRTEAEARKVAQVHYASCVGRVAMWGKVVEHSAGWRAECAYPLELILIANREVHGGLTAPAMWSEQAVDLLGLAYGVPVTVEGRA